MQMGEEGQPPEITQGGELLYEYRGPIYNRPCGRGICLINTEPEQYLEYALDDGN